MNARGKFSDREFPMTDVDYQNIQSLAYKITGIKLTEHKKDMVYGRLARRLRRLNLNSFADYCTLIAANNSPELPNFVNSITTNLTAFFREAHHFDFIKDEVLPRLLRENQSSKRIRFWSAGCSTGEEAYSLAMVLSQFSLLRSWDVKILATDLDSNVVERAKQGIYDGDRAEKVPSAYSNCLQGSRSGGKYRIKQAVSSLVTFKQLNLLHQWPMKGPFDVIFCRNVVIYFDMETQKLLFDRYADMLCTAGHLFIGHSENLHNISNRYESLGRTIYRKKC
ncbi:CheR family methyltransferase [Agaribacterium haliotis]|uniref:CheR family methyltransferase n=1 Tax=Agaribacterium haliotis TaxID=2013869 RepID=UPI00195E1A76|nr:protein-glutamate O-methyltransferase [Agaribacterium haliotis]